MRYLPKDHLPKSVKDDSREKAQEALEHLKALYRHAKRVATSLTTVTERQQQGSLTRSEAAVLGRMILANLRASARGELHYRPGRARLAQETGYSERTVSKALAKLKDLDLIHAARYSKGGRVKAHGLVTEWRSGGLDGLLSVLKSLGYRLGKGIAETVSEAVNWAREKLTKRAENKQQNDNPTGKLVPGTLVCKPNDASGMVSADQDAEVPPPAHRQTLPTIREREQEPVSMSLPERIRFLAGQAAARIKARHSLELARSTGSRAGEQRRYHEQQATTARPMAV
jgi:DNA-binding transcriptional ArsR family regulator